MNRLPILIAIAFVLWGCPLWEEQPSEECLQIIAAEAEKQKTGGKWRMKPPEWWNCVSMNSNLRVAECNRMIRRKTYLWNKRWDARSNYDAKMPPTGQEEENLLFDIDLKCAHLPDRD